MRVAPFALLLLGFLAPACAAIYDPPDQGDDPQDTQNLLGLATFVYQDSGNCLQSVRQSDNIGGLACSRTPRQSCALDRRIDLLGTTVVTQTTQDRYRTAWARLVDTYPDCTTASAAAVSLAAFRASTPTEIKNKNESHFQIIADCDTLNSQNGAALISRFEHDFVFSPRGVLAAQALTLSRNFIGGGGTGQDVSGDCFRQLVRFDWETTLLNDIADGNRATQRSCVYGGLNGGVLPCSTEETAIAHPFDFDQPL
ncbi:MAG: hypothetical protein NXI24_09560 [bacterium]|nr:hypothetical protein [bacterium]